ncbi:hypothetical protein BGZ90_002357, partial [Linnemannia elongata]
DNAALFKVRYANNYKVVTNTAGKKDFVLYQCGTTPPSASQFANDTIFVSVPVQAVASLTTTSVAYIEMLGKRSALKVVDTEGLVSSPCVQLGLEKGEIVGLEDANKTLRAEQFKGADIVFGSGFSVENGTETKTVGTSEVSDPGPLNGTFTTSTEFLAAIKDVDVIIDETFAGSDMAAFLTSYGLTAADTANYKFLANKAVFREDGLVNPNDGRDWFGGAVVMADAALQDVIRATHPDALPKDIKYNWLRNIANNEPKQSLSSANCTATDATTPVPDRAIVCSTMKAGNAANKAVAGSALTAFVGLLAAALLF